MVVYIDSWILSPYLCYELLMLPALRLYICYSFEVYYCKIMALILYTATDTGNLTITIRISTWYSAIYYDIITNQLIFADDCLIYHPIHSL